MDHVDIREHLAEWKQVKMRDDVDNQIRQNLREEYSTDDASSSTVIFLGKRRSVWRRVVLWGSIGAAAILTASILSPLPTSAVLRQVFRFIPGYARVQKSTAGSSAPLVLQKPLQVQYQGETITITGMVATADSLSVKLSGAGFPPFKDIHFINSKGVSYNLSGGSTGIGNNWMKENSYYGKVTNAAKGTLVLGSHPSVRVPIQLSRAKSVQSLQQLGPTDTKQGITVAAISQLFNGKVHLSFVSQHPGNYQVSDYASNFMSKSHPTTLKVTNGLGKSLKVHPVSNMGPTQFSFVGPATGSAGHYHVTLPSVIARYKINTRVKLPVPSQTSLTFRKQVSAAGLPFVFTKARWVQVSGQRELQYTVHMVPKHPNTESLDNFSLNPFLKTYYANQWHVSKKTGVVTIDMKVGSGRRSITVDISEVDVRIKGPWEFNITLPKNTVK